MQPIDPPKEVKEEEAAEVIQPQHKDSMASEQKMEPQFDDKLQQRKREDAKSIFIQNVDYKSTPQQLKIIFQDCGIISRITIAKDPLTKQPKGFAYLSFQNECDVQMALNLSGTKLRGRTIRIKRKRTNLRGMTKKTPQQISKHILNGMMIKMANQQNFRGKPRGRGK